MQLLQKFVPRCLVRVILNERSRSTPLDPKLMFLCVSFRSRVFGTVLLLHETCRKMRQTGAINAKVRATMSCLKFFTTNAPDQHHSTLNSGFGAFLFCLGAFGTVLLLHKTCCKMSLTSAINAKDRAAMSC